MNSEMAYFICSSARLETSLFEEYLEVNANVPTLEWHLYWHHLFCFSMSQLLGWMQPQLCPLFSFFKGREGLYCLTNINSLRRNSCASRSCTAHKSTHDVQTIPGFNNEIETKITK